MQKTKRLLAVFGLSLCFMSSLHASTERWFSPQQVGEGRNLFQQHCAVCHGPNAEATPNWKQTDANGNYPPPPLNGSAHAWHHDLSLLRSTVREGGIKLGGQMPPFGLVLDARQIDSVIAFFQSQWPDETYAKWAGRFEVSSDLPAIDDLVDMFKPNTRYLKQRLGDSKIGVARPSAIPGLYQIGFGEQMLYLTEDGEYAIIGELIDLKRGLNLSK